MSPAPTKIDNEYIAEIWKPVPTHQGYFVTQTGKIRGPSGKILKPMQQNLGYLYVLTPLPRRPRKLFIHRAVLSAFVGRPKPKQEVRHLNGNPRDNNLNNLMWGDKFEQHEDARRHGTNCIGERSGTAKLSEAKVQEIKLKIKTKTLRKLGAEYGVSHTAIRRAALGITWKHLKESI
ncbi:MAG: HNH endonuclease [Candidatus Omnitrophica bacterium]|nr:HNH endonuclease [Candidatus Omnitrophota bacterium]